MSMPKSKSSNKTRKRAGKRKSVSIVVDHFVEEIDSIVGFTDKGRENLPISSRYHSWFFDYAVIRLYREFELFVLKLLIAAIHQDTTTLQKSTQLSLPKRIGVDVCEFLIVGHGFFDLKGRAGAITKLKNFLPDNHYIVTVIADKKYLECLDLMFALRNFAAHTSKPSKKTALNVLIDRHKREHNWSGKTVPPAGAPPVPKNIGSSGQWLMSKDTAKKNASTETRFAKVAKDLKKLALAIQAQAPF